MNYVIYVLILLYMIYRLVYGTDQHGQNLQRSDKSMVWKVGGQYEIACRGNSREQKIFWKNQHGEPVYSRQRTSRVYIKERKRLLPEVVLVLRSAQVNDTGIWTCVLGTIEQDVEVCIVLDPYFKNITREVTSYAGRTVALSCTAAGNPEPEITWHRNGILISDVDENGRTSKYILSKKYLTVGQESYLTIVSLDRNDSGVFTCQAKVMFIDNAFCTNQKSINITLAVHYKPIVRGSKTEIIYAGHNESVNLLCDIDAAPEPTYKWYIQNYNEITEFPIDIQEENKSIINVISNEDEFHDMYICVAKNPYGESSQVFQLRQKPRPETPNEITIFNITHSKISVLIRYPINSEMLITGFTIQCLEKHSVGSNETNTFDIAVDGVKSETLEEFVFEVNGLKSETEYWMYFRAEAAGVHSDWSRKIIVFTNEFTGFDVSNLFDVTILLAIFVIILFVSVLFMRKM